MVYTVEDTERGAGTANSMLPEKMDGREDWRRPA
jgi:hypothetical protein